MTERIKKSVSILLALLMVFSVFSSQVFASNSEEIESYLDSAYAKAIDPYGSTTKNDDGQYIIPLSKTSLTLKKEIHQASSTPQSGPAVMNRLQR